MLLTGRASARRLRSMLRGIVIRSVAASFALISFSVVAQDLTIGQYVLVSKNRVGGNLYDFVLKASITNTGPSAINVAAKATSGFAKVQILDGDLSFGVVASGQTVQSSDTFTVRSKKKFDKRLIHSKEDEDEDDDDYREGPYAVLAWSFTFDVDTTPPAISGQTPKDVVLANVAPTVSAQYQDSGVGVDVSKVLLKLDNTNVSAQASISATSVSYQASALTEGLHSISLSVADRFGNVATDNWSFTVDTLPPVISGETPKNLVVTSATPTLSAQYQDVVGIDLTKVTLTLDGTNVTGNATVTPVGITNTPTVGLAQGAHTVVLAVADKAGNITRSQWNFTVDTLPAVISGQSPGDGSYVQTATPTIAAQYQDAGGINRARVNLTVDGTDVTANATVMDAGISYQPASPLAAGTHAVALSVVDQAGNSVQASWSFSVDATPPTISAVTPKDTTVPTATPTISAQYQDAESGIDPVRTVLTLDGANVTANAVVAVTGITYVVATALTGGLHNVALTVYDKAGNMTQASWSFSVDSSPPTTTGQSPIDTRLPEDALPIISVSYSDTESGIDITKVILRLDGVDITASAQVLATGATYQTTSKLSEGFHAVHLEIKDGAGNTATSDWRFEIATPPLISNLMPDTTNLTSGQIPIISANYSDGNSGVDLATLILLVDGVNVVSSAQVTGTGVQYTSQAPLADGQHTILLDVTDKAGYNSQAAWSFDIAAPPTYSLQIAAPTDGAVVTARSIEVRGVATASTSAPRLVTVNGVVGNLSAVPQGYAFTAIVNLAEGNNELNVVAEYLDGQTRTLKVSINYDGPPIVTIASPQDLVTLGPTVATSPRNLSGVVERPVQVSGSVSKDIVSVTVNQQEATVSGRNFTFNNFFLHEGTNLVTVVATDASGRTGSASITVAVDQTAPILAIEHPADRYVTSLAKIDVRGLVNDAVEGLVGDREPVVTVNTMQAQVGDRYFIASGVPLNVGENQITVSATDQAGNSRTKSISVTRILGGANRLSVISGGNQTGPINTELPRSLTAVALNAQGQPLANHDVTFDILRGTGGVSATPGGTPSRNITVVTDSNGMASVYAVTGKQSGFANNVVRASSVDVRESVLFYATGQAGIPHSVKADMLGINQYAETGTKVLEPLFVIVMDASSNRVPGVNVTFKVEEGDATFDGQPQVTLTTDKNGITSARPTLGPTPGHTRITATVGNLYPATFTVTALAPSDQPTRFSGIVMNDRQQPLPGVQLSISRTPLTVTSDAQGKFSFDANVPPGKIDLFVDGRSATVQNEVYPALHFEVLAVRGQDNRLPQPIYLPPLNTPETKIVGGDQDVVLRIPGINGFAMKVFARSVTFPDGTRTGPLVVSNVNLDKLPMVPPGGAAVFMAPAWTIQPAGTRFDPPIEVTIPNTYGLKPGQTTNTYQWDHDLATFVPIGRATVNEDGSFLVSEAGSGITKAGWGGNPPPPPEPEPDDSCGQDAPPRCDVCERSSTNSSGCASCEWDESKEGTNHGESSLQFQDTLERLPGLKRVEALLSKLMKTSATGKISIQGVWGKKCCGAVRRSVSYFKDANIAALAEWSGDTGPKGFAIWDTGVGFFVKVKIGAALTAFPVGYDDCSKEFSGGGCDTVYGAVEGGVVAQIPEVVSIKPIVVGGSASGGVCLRNKEINGNIKFYAFVKSEVEYVSGKKVTITWLADDWDQPFGGQIPMPF